MSLKSGGLTGIKRCQNCDKPIQKEYSFCYPCFRIERIIKEKLKTDNRPRGENEKNI